MKKKMLFASMLATLLCCILMAACGEKQITLTGISVAGVDDKTFEVGHELVLEDFAELTVAVEYSDETQNKTLSLNGVSALPEELTVDMIGRQVVSGSNTVTVTYSEGDVSKSDTFNIQGVVPEFTVTYPSNGINVSGPSKVNKGEVLSFTVALKDGYRIADGGMKVYANDAQLTEADGKYSVSNVQTNVVIAVTGVELIPDSVEVYAPDVDGVIFTGAETVEIGSDYEFSIALEKGYIKSEDFCVKVNGEVVTENEEGKYVVENVSGEFTITVTGVEQRTLNVEFEGVGFIAPETLTVRYGGNYYFSVTVDSNYSDSESLVKVYLVGADSKTELTANNGTYVVENVVENVTISVEGLQPNSYTVTPPETPGITFSGADSTVAFETYSFGIGFKDGFFAGPGFEAYAVCGGEKVAVTLNEETGKYEFKVSGQPVIHVNGVYKNVKDIAMAQWPDENSLEVTESADVPAGYSKAHAFTMGWNWGYRKNIANLDISKYSAVAFKIKATDLQEGGFFHLYQGDNFVKNFYYADTTWHEIVLTVNNGVWTMTADGAEVEGFTSTATNLKDVFNFALGNAAESQGESHFVVSNIIGAPIPAAIKAGYEEVIGIAMAQYPDENSIEVTASDDIPDGYTKAYGFTEGWQWGYRRNLANVDISGYSTVSFMIRATDLKNPANFHLYQGNTYLKNFYYADDSWHEIVLTNNNGTWSMTVDGDEVAAFSSTETNLKDMFNVSLGNTTEFDGESHFFVSNVIGIKKA